MKAEAASSLSPYEAIQAYKLEQETYKVEWQRCIQPPSWALAHIARANRTVLSKATGGEAFAHLLIDPVVMAALDEHERCSKI